MNSDASTTDASQTQQFGELRLPPQFADLSGNLEWVLLSEDERTHKRVDASIASLRVFYERMMARMQEIIGYLTDVDLDDMTVEQETLLRLAIAAAEIADAVEFYAPDSTAPIGVGRFSAVHAGLRWSRADSRA